MKYLSVCSGIEAATQAWHPLGWDPVAFSEIEPFPCAVLAHHYPHVPNWGDMTKFQEWPDADVSLLVGGTPCQSFSVAGLRKGLADPRGNLMLTYLAIAARYRPRWLVWENVPGVLSSNGGRDFGSLLGGLAELGYGFAYRVLDAQFVRVDRFPFAVPQRRRRVFVVGYLGDWRRAAAVLFDRESLSGHSAPRREAGKGVAAQSAYGVAIRGREGGGTAELTGPISAALRASQGGGDKPHVIASTGNVAHCLNAGGMGRIDYETETMIAHALRGEGFDASEDGTGRGTPLVPVAFSVKDYGGDAMEGVSPTLRAGGFDASHANGGVMPAVAFDLNQITSKTNRSTPRGDVLHTMQARSCPPHLAQPIVSKGNETLYPNGVSQGSEHARTSKTNPGAILSGVRKALGEEAFAEWGLGILDTLQPAEVLRSALHGRELRPSAFSRSWVVNCALSRPQDRGTGAVQSLREAGGAGCSPHGWEPSEQRAIELGAYLSGLSQPGPQAERFMLDLWQASEGLGLLREALSAVQAARRSAGGQDQSAHDAWAVRRLTPEECEFLQAMPRGFTNVPYRNRPQTPDGPRYKALGNSFAVNVVAWLGERIDMVERMEIAA